MTLLLQCLQPLTCSECLRTFLLRALLHISSAVVHTGLTLRPLYHCAYTEKQEQHASVCASSISLLVLNAWQLWQEAVDTAMYYTAWYLLHHE
jgi:hypothetical protein